MPDLNSLPPSRSPSSSRMIPPANNGTSVSPPSPSSYSPHSLAATAAFNAGARGMERRRSSARMQLNLSESGNQTSAEGGPSPALRASSGSLGGIERHGRLADRERAPSLGELHQELEQEQEGQVNRLLFMIRQQQSQIQQLQLSQPATQTTQHAIDDSTPTSERSMSLPHPQSTSAQAPTAPALHAAPSAASSTVPRSRSPYHSHPSLSRQSSYRSSRNNSPLIRPTSGAGHHASESRGSVDFTIGTPARERDDAAFYAAETQMLSRENAMLRLRIRELERQLREPGPSSATSATGEEPSQPGRTDPANG